MDQNNFGKLPNFNYKYLEFSYIILLILHFCNMMMLVQVSSKYFDQFNALNDLTQIFHITSLGITLGINIACTLCFVLHYQK